MQALTEVACGHCRRIVPRRQLQRHLDNHPPLRVARPNRSLRLFAQVAALIRRSN